VTPPQKPGRSKQDYGTPPAFVRAVEQMLGIKHFDVDLAASRENAVASSYYTEADDALKHGWFGRAGDAWCFLNPPYARIAPWVEKCDEEAERGLRIAALLPAAVGSNWFARHVAGKAHVLFLRPRLVFVGETAPYPKDLMLCLYDGPRVGHATWDWKGGTR
jgi:phage N-6-adenine-methyltransferase